jgi:pyruvate,water dikinase
MLGVDSKEANILWFREIGKDDIPVVGGKGANLGEMANSNFPVPPGFVVTAKAYFRYLHETGIKDKVIKTADSIDVENNEQLQAESEKIRELIKRTKMGSPLANEIKKAYVQLCEKRLAWLTSSEEEFVAVRSSATAEDLPTASFAGQQETFLNIKGQNAVVDAVQRCWASLFTARAIYYRKMNNFETEKVGIAVVVQKMVDSKISGVMFTANPIGDETMIVIEAVFGLGETIVSGSVTPDTYFVEKGSTRLLQKQIHSQEFKLVREGKENVREKLPPAIARKQKLPDKTIIELAKLGKQIESHYKQPQDIEWAIEEKQLLIVQSRPITTLGLREKVVAAEKRKKQMHEVEDKIILRGLAASQGIGTGKARIVLNASQIGKISKGDVLVAKMTTPDWLPAMRKSSAIITDEGGVTCHAAIVSRELGIPCVVGTEKATGIIEDNEIVTVNGFDGVVYKGIIEIEKPVEEKAAVIEKEDVDKLEKVLERELKEGEKRMPGKAAVAVEEIAERVEEEKEWEQRVAEERAEVVEKVAAKAQELVEEYGAVKAEEMPAAELLLEEEKLVDLLRTIAVKVKVNVALPDVAEQAAATGADGVGLLRAEHMITAAGKHPAEFIREGKEEELVKAVHDGIKQVAERFKGKPIWYRTFDARSDEFRELKGGEKEPHEDNPMLGWHGIRRDLDEPALLRAQFKAIKELVEEGFDNLGIMLPFVQNAEELRKAKEIAAESGLLSEKVRFGVMIETPAAVWSIDELIREGIDFVSFGTNDLTQLTLGIDRNNEKIQKLFSELHPAILRQLRYVIKKCKRAGVQTSICGQAGSNKEMVRQLVRYGIDSVSANIDAVEEIRRTVLIEEKKLILDKEHKK